MRTQNKLGLIAGAIALASLVGCGQGQRQPESIIEEPVAVVDSAAIKAKADSTRLAERLGELPSSPYPDTTFIPGKSLGYVWSKEAYVNASGDSAPVYMANSEIGAYLANVGRVANLRKQFDADWKRSGQMHIELSDMSEDSVARASGAYARKSTAYMELENRLDEERERLMPLEDGVVQSFFRQLPEANDIGSLSRLGNNVIYFGCSQLGQYQVDVELRTNGIPKTVSARIRTDKGEVKVHYDYNNNTKTQILEMLMEMPALSDRLIGLGFQELSNFRTQVESLKVQPAPIVEEGG